MLLFRLKIVMVQKIFGLKILLKCNRKYCRRLIPNLEYHAVGNISIQLHFNQTTMEPLRLRTMTSSSQRRSILIYFIYIYFIWFSHYFVHYLVFTQ